MPLTRFVKPDTLLTSPWHFALLFRLPPELRQLAFRNFSTTACAPRAKRGDEVPPFLGSDEESDILSSLVPQREDGVKLQQRISREGHSHARRPYHAIPSLHHKPTREPRDAKTDRNNAASSWRKVPLTSRDGSVYRGKPVTRRFQYMMEQESRKQARKGVRLTKHMSGKGNAGTTWRTVGIPVDGTMASRLAVLKEKIMRSPGVISETPEIREQLQELESVFRQSLQPSLGQRTPTTPASSVVDGGKQVLRNGAIQKSALSTSRSEDARRVALSERINGPSEVQDHSDMHEQGLESASASNDESELAKLKAQIQELTSLVKTLMHQNGTVPSSTLEKSSSDQASVTRKSSEFASLPHELDFRPIDTTLDGTLDIIENRQVQPRSRRYRDARLDDEQEALLEETTQEENKTTVLANSIESKKMKDEDSASAPEMIKPSLSSDALDSATLDDLGSLYDELFPDTSPAPSKAGSEFQQSNIPRLKLPRSTSSELAFAEPKGVTRSALARTRDGRGVKPVLVLRYASKTLTEDDFRRAMPRGEHIKEWMHNGEFEKVIPTRNPYTLERTGDYWIIFKTRRMADAFQAHVKKVHNLSRQRAPRTLLSPLPPAPNLIGPEVVTETELLKDFTLVPPSMPLWLEKELNGVAYKVLHRGGYPQVLAGGLGPDTSQVLLETQGGHTPNWYQVHDAIEADGRARNMPWELQPGDLGIRKVEMGKPSIKDVNDEIAREVDRADDDDQDQESDDNDILTAEDKVRKPKHGQRWIIAFKDKDEASRFARTWHRRFFPWPEDAGAKKLDHHLERTMVNAEVLW